MSVIRAILAFGLATSVFAVQGTLESLRSEVQNLVNVVSEQEERLSFLESGRDHVALNGVDLDQDGDLEQIMGKKTSKLELARKLLELDRRMEEIGIKVKDLGQQTELGLADVKEDIASVKASLRTTNAIDIETDHVINAELRQMVFGYVNQSLRKHGLDRHHVTDVSRSPGCQAGTVGSSYYPGIEKTYPRRYLVIFNQAFSRAPQFMYGISQLDSAAIVRVRIKVVAVGTRFATIEVGTWNSKHLYGAYVRWMACP